MYKNGFQHVKNAKTCKVSNKYSIEEQEVESGLSRKTLLWYYGEHFNCQSVYAAVSQLQVQTNPPQFAFKCHADMSQSNVVKMALTIDAIYLWPAVKLLIKTCSVLFIGKHLARTQQEQKRPKQIANLENEETRLFLGLLMCQHRDIFILQQDKKWSKATKKIRRNQDHAESSLSCSKDVLTLTRRRKRKGQREPLSAVCQNTETAT